MAEEVAQQISQLAIQFGPALAIGVGLGLVAWGTEEFEEHNMWVVPVAVAVAGAGVAYYYLR